MKRPIEGNTHTTYREVFSNRAFSIIYIARLVSISVETLRTVAVSILVFDLTGSAALSAITYGISFVPQLFGAVFFGSLADRIRPRVMISAGYVTQTLITVVVCIPNIPIAVALSTLAIGGLLSPLFGGASNKAIASELTGDAYVVGRSLTSMANSFGQMIGLAIGGLSVSFLGISRSLIICACTYLACAVVIGTALRIDKVDASDDRQSLLKGSLKNIRTIVSQPGMPLLFAMQWAPIGIFAGAEGLLVPFVAQQWDGSVSPGALMVALPIGMFVGQGTLGRLLTPHARQQLVCPLMCVMGAPLALFVIVDDPWVLWVALFVSGIGFAYSLGLQLPFAEELGGPTRGQGFALLGAGLMTVQGIGPAVGGASGDLFGVGMTIAACGSLIVIVALVLQLTGAWPDQFVSEHENS